jgi:cellulose synthase/poly-beta-1,6-N-acetylglucosamine synthase-like glycosyltransferase
MTVLELIFWLLAAGVAYTYVGYPLLLALWAWLRPRPVRRGPGGARSFSVVLCVRNEEARIGRRLDELTSLIEASGLPGEVVVVSDGSTDGTAALARAHTKGPVRVLELPDHIGKAAALSAGCAAATGEVLLFADVRQTWAPDALDRLLQNFADPEVGGVSGELIIDGGSGALAGVGLYWGFEKWLRRNEGLASSVVGATGAISAVRRELFRPIPAGTVLDDVYWPLQVVLQGKRVVFDPGARAYDRLPHRVGDEFRRKVRTLSGNFQLAARLPQALLPWRCGLWFQLLSHKLLRLAAPWALLALLVVNAFLTGPLYQTLLWLQVGCYGIAAVGALCPPLARWRPLGAATSFLVLNAAAWLAFWVWVSGRTGCTWTATAYRGHTVRPPSGKAEAAAP